MKLSEIAKEILLQSYNVTDQAGEKLHIVDVQDVMDILNSLASDGDLADVSPRFFSFAEWAAGNYIRLHGTWVHKFADQRKKENYISTEDLWNKYNTIFQNEG